MWKQAISSLLLLFAALPASTYAAPADSLPSRWSLEGGVLPSWQIPLDKYSRRWLKRRYSTSIHLEAGRTSLPQDSDSYAHDYGYPTLAWGVAAHFSDVTMRRTAHPSWGLAEMQDYDSRLGNAVSFYGKFSRPFFRTRHWTADYVLGYGLGWHHLKYNPRTNVDDELMGSRWSMYFTAGLHVGYRFAKEWVAKAGVEYYHHSNGALNRPNKGSNNVGAVVALQWSPNYEDIYVHRYDFLPPPFHRYFYATLLLGLGGKTFDGDWQRTQFRTDPKASDYSTAHFHVNPVYEVSTAMMYRYARRWASGLGVDVSYIDLGGEPYGRDGHIAAYNRWSVGVSAQHEVFYHDLSVRMALGWYLHHDARERVSEMEKRYYENIGVFYTFRHFIGLKVGVNVKAHKTKADFSSLRVVIPVWKSK